MTPPLEVRLAAMLLGGSGALFLATGIIRWAGEGDAGVLNIPIVFAVLGLAAGGGVWAKLRLSRPVALCVAVLAALLHMIVALNNGPLWIRVVSGLIAASQVYVLVLLNTLPARDYAGHGQPGGSV